ncbi:MAG TPA: hypothetical protein VGM83_19090 [Devosiaceae bacterium]
MSKWLNIKWPLKKSLFRRMGGDAGRELQKMAMDKRITGGLAWAGLLLIVGVPSVDALTSVLAAQPAAPVVPTVAAPAAKPATTPIAPVAVVAPIAAPTPVAPPVAVAKPVVASVAEVAPVPPPAKPVAVAAKDTAVDNYLASGKSLPSYISGVTQAAPAEKAEASQPVVVETSTPAKPSNWVQPEKPTQIASIAPQPQEIAPIPMPASMRPHPKAVQRVDPQTVASTNNDDEIVDARDLQDWKGGSLADFLARRQHREATDQSSPDGQYTEYDANGFFLNGGPNSSDAETFYSYSN